MRAKIYYVLAGACALMSLVMTYIILDADKSIYHWIAVAAMMYGAYKYYNDAEKLAG